MTSTTFQVGVEEGMGPPLSTDAADAFQFGPWSLEFWSILKENTIKYN